MTTYSGSRRWAAGLERIAPTLLALVMLIASQRVAAQQARFTNSHDDIAVGSPITRMGSKQEPVAWTVMVYCCADNNLDEYGVEDLNELEYAGSTDRVHMIYLLDRRGWDDTRLYYVTNDPFGDPGGDDMNIISLDISNRARSWLATEEDMGNPQTLEDFILWTMAEYPAEHYFLSIWDHGSGIFMIGEEGKIFKGECWDDHGGSVVQYIDLAELRDVLWAAYVANDNRRIDVVGHDACLMGQVETYYQMEPYVAYGIASEVGVPLDGYEYGYTFKALIDNPSMHPAELAEQIVIDYGERYGPHSWMQLAAVDLSALLNHLVPRINDFSDELCRYLVEHKSEINAAKGNAFYCIDYENPDLYHFAELVHGDQSLPSSLRDVAQHLMDVRPEVITAEFRSDSIPDACAMTIWFPGNFYHNRHRDDYRIEIDFHYEDWQNLLRIFDTPVVVTLPDTTFALIQGNDLRYNLQVSNKTGENQSCWGAAYVTMPDGKPYRGNPVLGPQRVELVANATMERVITHSIPGNAPLGTYTYTIMAIAPPDYLVHRSSFSFEIILSTERRDPSEP
jgi:hypothetical protein